jgi:hypothetical protein
MYSRSFDNSFAISCRIVRNVAVAGLDNKENRTREDLAGLKGGDTWQR